MRNLTVIAALLAAGFLLPILAAATESDGLTREECIAWVGETYRVEALLKDFGLDLAEDVRTLDSCLELNVRQMPSPMPRGWCDNAFKIHCSALDALTEIGEAQVERCGEILGAPLDSCAAQKVFDRYSREGRTSDEGACRAARRKCAGGAAGEPSRSASLESAGWTRWGGPAQDFRAPAGELATTWPAEGPEILWRRALGDGYSAILFEDGRLYTMARAVEGSPPVATGEESVLCLDAATGETEWEHRYDGGDYGGLRGYGVGPRSTPLIAGERIFTVGITGQLHALATGDGTVHWSRKLLGAELQGTRLGHGYSSSPVAHDRTVIVPVGGEKASLVAFDQETGEVAWRAPSFRNSYSSPRLVEIAGEEQLLIFMAEELLGIDPATGELLWRYPHGNQWGHNISMPLVMGEDTLFFSSPQAGARGLRLASGGEGSRWQELWHTRRVQLYHGSAVSDGGWVYGSSGVTSPAFLFAINAHTGEIGWRRRGFAKANVLQAGGKLLILDEDGVLTLATATPEDLTVHARAQLLESRAWTVPTLVGTTLYVRDRGQILAADLG